MLLMVFYFLFFIFYFLISILGSCVQLRLKMDHFGNV